MKSAIKIWLLSHFLCFFISGKSAQDTKISPIPWRCKQIGEKITLRQTKKGTKCFDGTVISVSSVIAQSEKGVVYKEMAIPADDTLNVQIVSACNWKNGCDDDEVDSKWCDKYEDFQAVFTCINNVSSNVSESSIKTFPASQDDGTSLTTWTTTHSETNGNPNNDNDNRFSVTTSNSEEERKKGDEENNTKTIIIAVVVSLVFVTAVVVSICLLFYCCVKSPLYKGGCLARHRGATLPQEGEYAYVDESKIEEMKSQFTDNTTQNLVIQISERNSLDRSKAKIAKSHFDDYAEISSNESLATPRETNKKKPQGPKVMFISAQDRQITTTSQAACKKSKDSSLQDVDRCGSDLHRSKTLEVGVSPSSTPAEYSSTLPTSGKHRLVSPSTDVIYSVTSSATYPSLVEGVDYHSISTLTCEYAHLTRPGQENRIIDNVYNG